MSRSAKLYQPRQEQVLTYDLDGNLSQDGRWDYAWDAENRLIAMSTTTAAKTAGIPDMRLEFGYDGQGRRIRKLVKWKQTGDTVPQVQSDTRFIYDGWNLIAEVEYHAGCKDAPTAGPVVAYSEAFIRRSYM